jgi:hypothetical protein
LRLAYQEAFDAMLVTRDHRDDLTRVDNDTLDAPLHLIWPRSGGHDDG